MAVTPGTSMYCGGRTEAWRKNGKWREAGGERKREGEENKGELKETVEVHTLHKQANSKPSHVTEEVQFLESAG